jgi:hypothetical protein
MVVLVVADIALGCVNIPLARAPALTSSQLGYSKVLGDGSRALSSPGVLQVGTPISNIDQFVDTCPTVDLPEIQSDFTLSLVGPIAASRPYKCTEPVSQMPASDLSDSLLVYQALRLILHMKLYKQLPWTSLHPYEWLRLQITDIQVNDATPVDQFAYDNNNNNRPTAFLRPRSEGDLYTFRTPAQFMAEFPPGESTWGRMNVGILGMAQLIMHEARHAVSTGGLPHDCDSKDSSLAYLGPWSVNYYVGSMVAQGQIHVGISNSIHAGDYILGIIHDLTPPFGTATEFCTPPTATSLTADFRGSSVISGAHPPHSVPLVADMTPNLGGKNVILFIAKGTVTHNGPWTAVLWNLGTYILYDTPFTSGFTFYGHVENAWFPKEKGDYCVIAGFPGDSDYGPAVADVHCGFTVNGAEIYSQLWDLTVVSVISSSASPGVSAGFNLRISGDSMGENVNLAFELYRSSLLWFTVTFSTNNRPAPYDAVMTVSVTASKSPGTYDLPFCAGITASPGMPSGLCLGSDIKWRHVTLTVIQMMVSTGDHTLVTLITASAAAKQAPTLTATATVSTVIGLLVIVLALAITILKRTRVKRTRTSAIG